MHDTKGARALKRFGSATWNGYLREGKGSVLTESRALESHPYTFFSRYGEKPGTNPEEPNDIRNACNRRGNIVVIFAQSYTRIGELAE
jgi:hypothetical protein